MEILSRTMSMKDYQKAVLEEMVQSQTLTRYNEQYQANEGISDEEIQTALITRYATKLNEALNEPYGRAVINGHDSHAIIKDYVDAFADLILEDCAKLWITRPDRDKIITNLREALDKRYHQ